MGAKDTDLKALIKHILSDRPRSGAPAKFTAEQIVDIIALACESPKDSGLPVSHWTPKELAAEAIKRNIVKSTIRPTRTEEDFSQHIASTLDSDPEAPWIFVVDQLNTHMSASLVERVVKRCGISDDLGERAAEAS